MAIRAPKVDSKEHEQEILGMALVDADTAKEVAKIPSSLFYYSRFRDIHKTIKLLIDQGREVDMLALITKLGNEYSVPVMEIGHHGVTAGKLKQRVNELRDIRFQHTVANLPADTTIDELESLIKKYKPATEEDRSYIPDKRNLFERVGQFREHGGLKTYSPGFEMLSKIYSIALGQMTIVTGIPGHGKSTFIDNVAVNMAKEHGWKFCMFSPESFPIEQHYARLIEIHSGASMLSKADKRLTSVPRISDKQLKESFEFVYDHIKSLYIPPEERTLDGIMAQVTDEYNGFILDPWNEIEHNRPSSMSETEYIGETLMRMKAYAVFKNIHVWLVAHPKKLLKEDGDYRIPEPYDISGSAHWYNKADMCIAIYHSKEDGSSVHIQKVRVRGTGKKGKVKFTFEYDTQRFIESNSTNNGEELPI